LLKKIFLTVLLLATFVMYGCTTQAAVNAPNVRGDLKISMLDIGHGDAILIRTGKQTILIDTAKPEKHAELVRGLEKLSVTKIDKLIITHPHGDHIGGAKMLINPNEKELAEFPYLEKISVAAVYDNGFVHTSPLYKNTLKATLAKNIPHQSLKVGDVLDFGNGVEFKVLWPTADFIATVNGTKFPKEDREHNLNNGSIVGKLTYKDFSMMFTGDCERASEAKIVANNSAADLKCDVLKSGHHGVTTSSTKKFVEAIHPSCVLISAGHRAKDNVKLPPPYSRVLNTYLAAGVDKNNIFCTRWNNTITLTSDGKNFSVEPETKEAWFDTWMAHLKTLQKK